jgi:hypothetical protein
MTTLFIQFMEARTTAEVNQIVWNNAERITNPFNERFFYTCARNARRRINRLRRETNKNTELKYKN